MQNATLETCKESESNSCYTPSNKPTIRLIVPNNSSLTFAANNNTMVLNDNLSNIITVNNNGTIGLSPSVSLVPKENSTFGLEMSIVEYGREIASLVYLMDRNQSVIKQDATANSSVNTPIILSSGFSIEEVHNDPIHTDIIGFKILRPASSEEIDEIKS